MKNNTLVCALNYHIPAEEGKKTYRNGSHNTGVSGESGFGRCSFWQSHLPWSWSNHSQLPVLIWLQVHPRWKWERHRPRRSTAEQHQLGALTRATETRNRIKAGLRSWRRSCIFRSIWSHGSRAAVPDSGTIPDIFWNCRLFFASKNS